MFFRDETWTLTLRRRVGSTTSSDWRCNTSSGGEATAVDRMPEVFPLQRLARSGVDALLKSLNARYRRAVTV